MTEFKTGAKPQDPEAQKGFQSIEQEISKKQGSFKSFDRAVKLDDLVDDEWAVAYVTALTETPSSPSSDEVRLYHRRDGRLYKWTSTEVT